MPTKINEFRGEYRFLSNFWPAKVTMYGVEYPSVEHAFVAAKTEDLKERAQVLKCKTAGQAKRLGRQLKLRPNWDTFRLQAMYELVRRKFQGSKILRASLLDTGDAILVEGNTWHDNFWGNCHCARCKNVNGGNHLGRILMKVREELKNG